MSCDLPYNECPRFTETIVSQSLLRSPFVFIDVGVQGGIGPRWEHLGPFLEVHGFDALPEVIAPLQSTASRHYYALALGNEDGEREFFVAPEKTASSMYAHGETRYDISAGVSQTSGVRRVPIRRLDSLVAEGLFSRADFIKIDVEGFEPEVLKGAQRLLSSGVLGIEIETNFSVSPVLPMSHFVAVVEQIAPHGFTLANLAFDRIPRASFARRSRELGIEGETVARPATVNALFYRDAVPSSEDEALKRAAILELYGMADTAFDVLPPIPYRDLLISRITLIQRAMRKLRHALYLARRSPAVDKNLKRRKTR